MIITDLSYLGSAESTNIVGSGGDMFQTFWQTNKIDVDQSAYSSSYATAFRGDATAISSAYNVLSVNASNMLLA